MAFLDNLKNVAKDVAEKGAVIAKDAAAKGADAIDTGKLTAKASAENRAAEEAIKQIGQYFFEQIKNGSIEVPEALQPIVATAKEHLEAAAAIKAEIEAKKAPAQEEAAAEEAPKAE